MIVNTNQTKQEIGFSELLTYQTLLTEKVIHCKNGALLGGFWYEGPDLESATKEEIEWLTMSTSRAFQRFGNGWMLHMEMIRKTADSYPSGSFKEPTNFMIDAERRQQHKREGGHFETKIALFFTYLPPRIEQSGFLRKAYNFLLGNGEAEFIDTIDNTLIDFEDKLGEFENVMTASRDISLNVWA